MCVFYNYFFKTTLVLLLTDPEWNVSLIIFPSSVIVRRHILSSSDFIILHQKQLACALCVYKAPVKRTEHFTEHHLKSYTHIQWCWPVCGGQTTQQQPTMFDERYWSAHALTRQCWNKVGESNINETNRNVQWMLDWQVFDENQTCNEHRLTLLNIVQQWWSYCWIDWISRMMFSEMLRFNVYLVDGSMVILRGPSAMAVEVWTTQADIWDKFSLKVVFWIWI